MAFDETPTIFPQSNTQTMAAAFSRIKSLEVQRRCIDQKETRSEKSSFLLLLRPWWTNKKMKKVNQDPAKRLFFLEDVGSQVRDSEETERWTYERLAFLKRRLWNFVSWWSSRWWLPSAQKNTHRNNPFVLITRVYPKGKRRSLFPSHLRTLIRKQGSSSKNT